MAQNESKLLCSRQKNSGVSAKGQKIFSLIEHVGGILSQKLLWFVKKFGIISSPNQLYNWNWHPFADIENETEWTTLTAINYFSTENIRRWKTAKIGLLE